MYHPLFYWVSIDHLGCCQDFSLIHKGKIVSAWKRRDRGVEGEGGWLREGAGGRGQK
jgi:hypothetical protein